MLHELYQFQHLESICRKWQHWDVMSERTFGIPHPQALWLSKQTTWGRDAGNESNESWGRKEITFRIQPHALWTWKLTARWWEVGNDNMELRGRKTHSAVHIPMHIERRNRQHGVLLSEMRATSREVWNHILHSTSPCSSNVGSDSIEKWGRMWRLGELTSEITLGMPYPLLFIQPALAPFVLMNNIPNNVKKVLPRLLLCIGIWNVVLAYVALSHAPWVSEMTAWCCDVENDCTESSSRK